MCKFLSSSSKSVTVNVMQNGWVLLKASLSHTQSKRVRKILSFTFSWSILLCKFFIFVIVFINYEGSYSYMLPYKWVIQQYFSKPYIVCVCAWMYMWYELYKLD